MKKNLFAFSLMFLLLGLFGGYATAQNNIKIVVNGTLINSPTQPRIIDGHVLVPLRSIAEALNANVSWEVNTSTVNINNQTLNQNLKFLKLNGKSTTWPYWEEDGKVYVVVEHYADLMRRYYSTNSAISCGDDFIAKDNRSYNFKPVKKGDFYTVSIQDLLSYGHFIPFEWDSEKGNLIIDSTRIK